METGVALKTEPGFNILKPQNYIWCSSSSAFPHLFHILWDIGTFYVFQRYFLSWMTNSKILTATVLSRILCSIATYILNRSAVFQSQAKSAGTAVRFVIRGDPACRFVAARMGYWLVAWRRGRGQYHSQGRRGPRDLYGKFHNPARLGI